MGCFLFGACLWAPYIPDPAEIQQVNQYMVGEQMTVEEFDQCYEYWTYECDEQCWWSNDYNRQLCDSQYAKKDSLSYMDMIISMDLDMSGDVFGGFNTWDHLVEDHTGYFVPECKQYGAYVHHSQLDSFESSGFQQVPPTPPVKPSAPAPAPSDQWEDIPPIPQDLQDTIPPELLAALPPGARKLDHDEYEDYDDDENYFNNPPRMVVDMMGEDELYSEQNEWTITTVAFSTIQQKAREVVPEGYAILYLFHGDYNHPLDSSQVKEYYESTQDPEAKGEMSILNNLQYAQVTFWSAVENFFNVVAEEVFGELFATFSRIFGM